MFGKFVGQLLIGHEHKRSMLVTFWVLWTWRHIIISH